ncbi:MAG: hypothetical protein LBV19_08885 [Streptococcaceae bacterium]|nr:hypothetical protein [Streptococcaceae bacterium]
MASIKRRFNKGYILLESLLALSLLTAISTFILSGIKDAQKHKQIMNQQIESLNLSKMALDANLGSLTANGASVKLAQNEQQLVILNDKGKEELRLEILEIQK